MYKIKSGNQNIFPSYQTDGNTGYTEQITVTREFLCLSNINKIVGMCENFIGFCVITNSFCEVLVKYVTDLFSGLSLGIQNVCELGYDGGSNKCIINKLVPELNN